MIHIINIGNRSKCGRISVACARETHVAPRAVTVELASRLHVVRGLCARTHLPCTRVVPGAVSLGLTDPCTHAIGHVITPDTHARLRSTPREVVHFNLIGISLVSHWYLIGISLDALLIDVNVL